MRTSAFDWRHWTRLNLDSSLRRPSHQSQTSERHRDGAGTLPSETLYSGHDNLDVVPRPKGI
ncbi:hypothetical protein F2P79_000760 [Pimephales promelas]|nr:hypothetical protein F2P79_000760 [Pimephales promelas]